MHRIDGMGCGPWRRRHSRKYPFIERRSVCTSVSSSFGLFFVSKANSIGREQVVRVTSLIRTSDSSSFVLFFVSKVNDIGREHAVRWKAAWLLIPIKLSFLALSPPPPPSFPFSSLPLSSYDSGQTSAVISPPRR